MKLIEVIEVPMGVNSSSATMAGKRPVAPEARQRSGCVTRSDLSTSSPSSAETRLLSRIGPIDEITRRLSCSPSS